jgi:hypothetical protein
MSARTNPVWIRPEGSLRAREMETEYDLAYDNPYGEGFAWNLSAKETAGVVAVGVGLAWLANKVSNTQTAHHQAAMLAGGTLLYTLGVVIGTNRPVTGFITDRSL